MAKRRKKKPCSITFHLPKEDITLNFEYYEFISSGSRTAKYKFIYFENSTDVMSTAYEKWHQMVFKYAFDPKPRYKPKPCDATVKIYDEEHNNIIEVFRLTEVLPERSMTGPLNDKKPKEKVVKYVDYKYLEKIEIEDNIIGAQVGMPMAEADFSSFGADKFRPGWSAGINRTAANNDEARSATTIEIAE